VFRNILVGFDGSPDSRKALAQAIDIALSERSRLTILTAVHRPSPIVYNPASASAVAQLAIDLERQARETLEQGVATVPAELPVTKILTREPIRCALMRRIKEGDHDLLVLGSRGRRSLKAALLGSVSRYALSHSPVPVLVAHHAGSPADYAADDQAAQPAGGSVGGGLSANRSNSPRKLSSTPAATASSSAL
jgi:nucleotide-binding universal stress UspA family protein